MSEKPSNSALSVVFGVVIVVIVVMLGHYVLKSEKSRDDANPYEYDIEQYRAVDPKLIGYLQSFEVDCVVSGPGALAVNEDGSIWIAGDSEVVVLAADGKSKKAGFPISGAASCMAVDGEAVFIGINNRVVVYSLDGKLLNEWESMGDISVLTSIASNNDSVCVADYGNRVVWRFDREGRLKGQLDGKDVKRHIPGFIVPSPYFDVAFDSQDELWIVNPGRHKVGHFSQDGELISEWGVFSMDINGFCGCCNPSHIAITPDGTFITAEKGLPRIKTFDSDGTFRDVVVSAEDFADALPGCDGEGIIADIAVDASGRVLVLDRKSNLLRVFIRKPNGDAGS